MENINDFYSIEKTCGDCIYYIGEECQGKHEGAEKYSDSPACDEHDCGEDYDIGS